MPMLALGLSACASLTDAPVPLQPLGAAATEPPCPARLGDGQRCQVVVQAAAWQTPTGVQVRPGEDYCVQVEPDQVWFDLHRRNVPPHGETGNWLMRMFSGLKRHAGIPWFSLVGAVHPADTKGPTSHQDLGSKPLVHAMLSGVLVLYPNDAVGPPFDPAWFYRNNWGQVRVTLQRCVGACACPVAPPR